MHMRSHTAHLRHTARARAGSPHTVVRVSLHGFSCERDESLHKYLSRTSPRQEMPLRPPFSLPESVRLQLARPLPDVWWLGTELNRIHWLFRPALCRRVPEPNFGGRCEN